LNFFPRFVDDESENLFWKESVMNKFKFKSIQPKFVTDDYRAKHNNQLIPKCPSSSSEEFLYDWNPNPTLNWKSQFILYSLQKPLLEAISSNERQEKVLEIISHQKIEVLNGIMWNSGTVLHYSIDNNKSSISLLLLNNGFKNMEATDARNETALHRAAWNGDILVLSELVKRKVELECRNWFGYTPLHLAAANGKYSIVKILIKIGADIEARSDYGETPLHRARKRGYVAVCDLLLINGANPEARNNYGARPEDFSHVKRENHIWM